MQVFEEKMSTSLATLHYEEFLQIMFVRNFLHLPEYFSFLQYTKFSSNAFLRKNSKIISVKLKLKEIPVK